MQTAVKISGKVLGKHQALFQGWDLTLEKDDRPFTLGALLRQIVMAQVSEFAARQAQRQLIQVLSPQQIAIGADLGKISAGGSELDQPVDVEQAVDNALLAFKDGLYFVFIDEVQQDDLEQLVDLQDGSQMLFLRLIPLVGG
jgi:hypothetical protein